MGSEAGGCQKALLSAAVFHYQCPNQLVKKSETQTTVLKITEFHHKCPALPAAMLGSGLRWDRHTATHTHTKHTTHTHALNVYMQRERSRCTQKKCCMYPRLLYAHRVTLFKYKHVANAPETGTHTHTYSHGRGNTGVFYISRSGHLGDIGIMTGFQQLFRKLFRIKGPLKFDHGVSFFITFYITVYIHILA